MTERDVRAALRGIDGVEMVELSAFSDIYTLTFRAGLTPDDATITNVFEGCAYNGRNVVVERDRKAVEDFALTGPRPLPAAPDDNPTSPGRVALGKKLYFETRLSAHGKMSCATCHPPEHATAVWM